MERYIATISGVIGASISFMVDGLGMAVTVLIAMMAIDYITGILSGIVNGNLNSRVGFNGILRKIYYLLLVGAVYAVSLVVPGIEYAGDGAAIALIVLELVSIMENGVKMGLPIPQFIQDLLSIVKSKTEKDGVKK